GVGKESVLEPPKIGEPPKAVGPAKATAPLKAIETPTSTEQVSSKGSNSKFPRDRENNQLPIPPSFSPNPSMAYEYRYTFQSADCAAYFLFDGTKAWVESSAGENGCLAKTYTFTEIRRSAEEVLLEDIARSFFVKIPIKGGWATY